MSNTEEEEQEYRYEARKGKQPPDKADVEVAKHVTVYTAIVFLFAAYFLTSIWPANSEDLALNTTRLVTLPGIGLKVSLGPETSLVLIIILFGIIGACIFSFFAIPYHLGYRNDFDRVWEAWYLLRPPTGAGLALVFYLLLRGGVLTIGADLKSLNLVGIAGISGLVGMFSEQAMTKLRELAVTTFGPAPGKEKPEGKDEEKGDDEKRGKEKEEGKEKEAK